MSLILLWAYGIAIVLTSIFLVVFILAAIGKIK